MRHPRSLLLFTAILIACVPCTHADAQITLPPHNHFVEDYEYFSSDAQFEEWFNLTQALRSNFDEICGDTFCEGDYSNIQSLGYHCSVEQASGRIGRCVWTFAGSYEQVDPATGELTVQARTWNCPTPTAPRTTITALLAALDGDEPLYMPLPGMQATIYDSLIDCL
jgi:hypothetical protein